jgi:hypothetical protein
MDDSQLGYGEKALPKFVPRNPIQPTRRRGRPARSGTMLSTDLRGTEGEKDAVSTSPRASDRC